MPGQLKSAVIMPVPKIGTLAQPSYFWPISITPGLSRLLDRLDVRMFILLQPHLSLDFTDQFAFRPSGSTTAAIVAMLHTVRSMMADNDYVHVF